MKKRYFLSFFLAFVLILGINANVEAAFAFKPVAFVLIDSTGTSTQEDFVTWREQVRQAYHVPYYEIIKGDEPKNTVHKVISESNMPKSELSKQTLHKIAVRIPAKIVVVVFLNRMEESLVPSHSIYGDDDYETLQQVVVSANMYIYKEENDKMLQKKLRYFETDEIPLSMSASDVIKYELRKLVNDMEGREQI